MVPHDRSVWFLEKVIGGEGCFLVRVGGDGGSRELDRNMLETQCGVFELALVSAAAV